MTTPTDLARLDAALRERLPPDSVSTDTERYSVDGLTPSLVVAPLAQEDVATVLGVANEAGAAIIPWGAGERMGLGMPPERYDLALDLRRLNRLVEYESADLTVTIEAGIELDELQRALAERGQWLPLDPATGPHETIGGLLATNASGPSRHAFGSARDLLIGIRVATAQGEVVKAGGRVVKNVAGYDLGKLHIGALGTLGVILQATFKVAPLPAEHATSVTRGLLSHLMSITSRLVDARLAIESVELTKDASRDEWRLDVRFAGGPGAVERSRREFDVLAGQSASLTDATEDAPQEGPLAGATVVARAGVLSTSAASICEAVASRGAGIVAYPTAGIAYAAWSAAPPAADELASLRRLCVESGRGGLVLERAPPELKRAVGVWGAPRGDFGLMRRLKEEFDPKRILNPGRFVGGL